MAAPPAAEALRPETSTSGAPSPARRAQSPGPRLLTARTRRPQPRLSCSSTAPPEPCIAPSVAGAPKSTSPTSCRGLLLASSPHRQATAPGPSMLLPIPPRTCLPVDAPPPSRIHRNTLRLPASPHLRWRLQPPEALFRAIAGPCCRCQDPPNQGVPWPPPRHLDSPSPASTTTYGTRTTTAPNTKYYYKPEEFGWIKSLRRPVFRQVRLPVSSSTTTAGDLGHAKYTFELSIPQTPSSTTTQVPQERLYLYCRRGSDKYPYNKCTSTVVFGIAKNVKHPFEMTRPTSSNDPKYLSENETYTATVARIETDKSEDASTTTTHCARV
ncbi:hypothetical protein CFC21_097871 [Triticum aestivum]|uniref:Uncharacterized protein n=2 Tax=Triticum aestivum TaxID=4565 RepID=A0A9R1N048_WHEAT|nr:hypothetical protein CFC21_097871 [Triticum aestivum]